MRTCFGVILYMQYTLFQTQSARGNSSSANINNIFVNKNVCFLGCLHRYNLQPCLSLTKYDSF